MVYFASQSYFASNHETGETSPDLKKAIDAYSISWKVWALWFVVFAVISAIYPRDAAWDVAHYHLHNGWSALNGRLSQDMAPADLHSFLNPTQSMLIWWLNERLPGPVMLLLLSPIHAAILPATYAVGARLALRLELSLSPAIILFAAFTGFMTLTSWMMVASVANDHWGALGFVLGTALILGKTGRKAPPTSFLLASLIVGAMTGIKLTNLIYVFGFAAMVILLAQTWRDRLQDIGLCFLAGGLGLALTGGWWAWTMYEMFQNPVFPHLNSLFGSPPLGPDEPFRDVRYVPDGWLHALLRPFLFSVDTSLIYEYALIDLRFLPAYLATLWILYISAFRQFRGAPNPQGQRVALAVAIGFLITFLVWSAMFSILRYAMALWVLGPVFALLLFVWSKPALLSPSKLRRAAIVFCGVILLTTSMPFMRRVAWIDWTEPYAWSILPDGLKVENSIVVFSSYYPSAFNAPAFAAADHLTFAHSQSWSRPAMVNYRPKIERRLAEHPERVFAVMFVGEHSGMRELNWLAEDIQSEVDTHSCKRLETSLDTDKGHWIVCRLHHHGRSAAHYN